MKKKFFVIAALLMPNMVLAANLDEEVTATAVRLPETLNLKLAQVQVLTAEEIKTNNSHNLAEAIALIPGINVSSYGGRGQNANFNIRGGSSDGILVLVDGNPIKVGLSGINVNTVPVSAIEKIEVLKGGRATFYGANAHEGVINIITIPEYRNKQVATYSYSSNATHDFTMNNTVAITDKDVVKVAFNSAKSDGYNVHPMLGLNDGEEFGLRERDLYLAYAHTFDSGIEASLSYSVTDFTGEYENGFITSQKNHNDIERHIVSFNSNYKGDFYSYDLGLSYNKENNYDHAIGVSKIDFASSATKVNTNSLSGHFSNLFQVVDSLALGLGVDFDRQVLDKNSNSYGEYGESDIVVINKAAYASLNYEQDIWLGEASYRIDDNSKYNHRGTFTLGAGANVSDWFKVGVRGGTAYRAPNFSELFYPNYGNKNLKPEKTKFFEIDFNGDVDTEFGNYGYYVNLFYTKYKDLIVSNYPFGYQNIEKSRNKGIEFGGSAKFTYLTAKFGAVLANPKNDITNQTVPNRSKQTYYASLDGRFDKVDYLARYDFISKKKDNYSKKTLGGYGLLNLGLGLNVLDDKVRFGFKVDNVFNKKYETFAGYPAPERIYAGTITIQNLF